MKYFFVNISRYIAYPDLKKAMKVLGFKVSKEQAKQLVRDMGTKHSG